jgi:lipoprotein-anchoring transpeptidase ErfK/SrfK
VQVYTKFKPTGSKKRARKPLHWGWGLLVVLACLGAWWWWTRPEEKPRAPRPEAPVRLQAFTPAVTNLPIQLVVTNPPVVEGKAVLPSTNRPPAGRTNLVVSEPAVDVNQFPRLPRDTFEVQLALARAGVSSGSMDGVIGSQTRAAIKAFQRREQLPDTGVADLETKSRLQLHAPPLANYLVTPDDLARLQPLSQTWLGKSQQSALDYESLLELVAERGHAHPALIKRLNPGVEWTNLTAGAVVKIPAVAYPPTRGKAAFLLIHLAGKTLQAFDGNTNLLANFPCSIAARVEKRPVGELHVAVVAPNPNYTFDPDVFPESAEAQKLGRKLILPPGPNNPVGVAWIGLDRPGYGIHGTPVPEQVGRTESHGCFRLANWNAEFLLKLVTVGTPVRVVE